MEPLEPQAFGTEYRLNLTAAAAAAEYARRPNVTTAIAARDALNDFLVYVTEN